MTAFRNAKGGRVDRARTLRFRFDGAAYEGLAGDTLASALLANGVHLVGRSFKYHRPRGILTAGAEEPNALVTVRRDAARETPNLRATQVELYDGLEARSQNRWPSLGFDVGRASDLLSPLFPAGFYYKTFKWPRSAWHALYEPLIRRAAGLGRAPSQPDPDHYAQRFAHCDVLVVGAGPAGLAAALAAAGGGARVILADEQPEPGGTLLDGCAASIDGEMADAWLAWTLAELAGNPRVRVLPRTTAFGYFPHNNLGLLERLTDHLAKPGEGQARERLWQVRAREVVLATGAIEQPLVFPGNDRPGVMLAGAARSYLGRFGVRAGTRAVLVTATDGAWRAALELAKGGIGIAAIADLRARAPEPAATAARDAGIEVVESATIRGTRGNLRVTGVDIDGRTHRCDLVLMSGGYSPAVHLFSQSRGRLIWSEAARCFVPSQTAERAQPAGACRGAFGLAAALADGAEAGLAAARASGHAVPDLRFDVSGGNQLPETAGAAARAGGPPRKKAFVDFQNDVTARDLALATREGFLSIEHVKRYTTTGMATDQGKTSSLNALGIVASVLGKTVPDVGHTTFRMPYTPVTFGTLAGPARGLLFDPLRTTPMHEAAVRRGAVFEDVGQWKRARYFPRAGEDMHAAVARECRAVRSAAGIFDVSTLGKIAVCGPGAAEFLNRLYVNDFSGLAPGRSRYGILLRDDGFIYDDGVIARLAPDRFHVTTTTGGAARVHAMMEDYRQTEWGDLEVWLTSVTEQWAVIAVQGPLARQVLSPLAQGIDLQAAALPHMAVAEGRFAGAPAMVFRVSFTGELGYEINVPADHGRSVWEAVCDAGAGIGITPYGTETMHVLRAEKGYIIVGQDTDGTATPQDAGLAWAIGRKKPDFLGKRSLERAAMQQPGRRQLVGLRTRDPGIVLEEGAQVVETAGQPVPKKVIGHVTSSYASAALGHSIALAMVADGRAREGATLFVPTDGRDVAVTVTGTVFYDPEGARLHA
ncbi:MAG TPA: sarcosine oxidase subunit alpha family protein [Steroidobacteraceae bacterium]|nr:sarcosine oxidase subunit alpha family protein [Steroidobacteraceae bacterium]